MQLLVVSGLFLTADSTDGKRLSSEPSGEFMLYRHIVLT